MEKLFEQFVTERKYLKNVSAKTEDWYWQSWKGLGQLALLSAETAPTKAEWAEHIGTLRNRNVSPVSINTYARAINAFLKWAHEDGHIQKLTRIPRLKEERKVIATLTEAHVTAILRFRPRTFAEQRLHALICLLLDTGMRADEALSLPRTAINLDDQIITIKGKGGKHRVVPMSLELRKALFRWLGKHTQPFVFGTFRGTKQNQRNVLQDLKDLGNELGISGVRFSFHTLRHTFATHYLRKGGNLFYLSRVLGHASISTTQIYLRSLGVDDFRAVHDGLSMLTR